MPCEKYSPAETVAMLRSAGVPDAQLGRMMGGNAIELFGLPVPAASGAQVG